MAGCVAEIGTRQHMAETSAAVHALLGKQLLLPWMDSGEYWLMACFKRLLWDALQHPRAACFISRI
jgi:hypothetical protein